MLFLEKASILNKVLAAAIFGRKTPLMVSWHITYRCNLKCRYCGFCENEVEELDTRKARLLIDEMALAGTKLVVFSGGEPLLRDDLPELIEYCKSKNMFVSITSNGTLVKERIKYIEKADTIKLSLDGPAQVNDFVRGQGVHDKVIEAIDICKDRKMEVSLTTVISIHNMDSIDYMLQVGRKYGVGVYFKPAAKNHCGRDEKDIEHELADPVAYKKIINYLIKRKTCGEVVIKNSLEALRYLHHWPQRTRLSCLIGKLSCTMRPDGGIIACAAFPGALRYQVTASKSFINAFERIRMPYSCDLCWCPSLLEINLLGNLKWQGAIEIYKSFSGVAG